MHPQAVWLIAGASMYGALVLLLMIIAPEMLLAEPYLFAGCFGLPCVGVSMMSTRAISRRLGIANVSPGWRSAMIASLVLVLEGTAAPLFWALLLAVVGNFLNAVRVCRNDWNRLALARA